MIVCWLLGNGSLFAWNSMLTIEDYYGKIFPVCTTKYFLNDFIADTCLFRCLLHGSHFYKLCNQIHSMFLLRAIPKMCFSGYITLQHYTMQNNLTMHYAAPESMHDGRTCKILST